MAKGIEYRPVPKEWYDYKAVKINEDDDEDTIKEKEFNQRILASKKPYFMIYNYDKLKREYNRYYKKNDEAFRAKFNMTVEELRDKKDKTIEEQEAYDTFAQQCPVNVSPSIINRIAWHIEKHYANKKLFKIEEFNIEKLKTPNIEYSTRLYNKVKAIREEYGKLYAEIIVSQAKTLFLDKEMLQQLKDTMKENMKDKMMEACKGDEVLATNVLIDICYSDNKSKDFLWEMCGEQLIRNLINNGYSTLRFPMKDEDGDIEFKGSKFKMKEVDANGISWE